MHRLLVDSELLNESAPALPKEAARHLKVLRVQEGEGVELFDGKGATRGYEARGRGGDLHLEAVTQVARAPRPERELVLFACITKGSRWDWTIEKATELGVTRIVPVISDRTIVRIPKAERAAKRERWQRIAEDAARQSDAKWLPEIAEPVDFADSPGMVKATRCFIGALTEPPSPSIAAACAGMKDDGRPVACYIGPEGDFTPEELAALMAVATPTSFGPTILRAETAAIFALSVLKGMMI